MAIETDSDDIPRCSRPDRVGSPLAAYKLTNKLTLEAMRAVGTVWGPEGSLQCLGSAALFSKEELTMGSDHEVDEARR